MNYRDGMSIAFYCAAFKGDFSQGDFSHLQGLLKSANLMPITLPRGIGKIDDPNFFLFSPFQEWGRGGVKMRILRTTAASFNHH
jgi:hypothetical protein